MKWNDIRDWLKLSSFLCFDMANYNIKCWDKMIIDLRVFIFFFYYRKKNKTSIVSKSTVEIIINVIPSNISFYTFIIYKIRYIRMRGFKFQIAFILFIKFL